MGTEIFHLPMSGTPPDAPSRDARVGEWREYDDLGGSLPTRSLAAEWTVMRCVFNVAGILGVVASIWLIFRVFGGAMVYMFGGFGMMSSPARSWARRYKQKLFRRAVGEENPLIPIVKVGYQIDGFEYGRDLGQLLFEGDWIFFEGQRSTFSLGKGDVSGWTLGSADGMVLSLGQVGGHMQIHIEPVSEQCRDLWARYLGWRRLAGASSGIAEFPPMEPNPRNDFRRLDKAGETVLLGVLGAVIGLIMAQPALGPLMGFIGAAAFMTAGATVAVVSHRIWVGERRRAALSRLRQVRAVLCDR